jgi:hypothetical protein
MNEERTGKCLQQVEHTRGHLWRVTRSLVVCAMFCRSLFVLFPFFFGHCVVCPSIYGLWLPLWYIYTLLELNFILLHKRAHFPDSETNVFLLFLQCKCLAVDNVFSGTNWHVPLRLNWFFLLYLLTLFPRYQFAVNGAVNVMVHWLEIYDHEKGIKRIVVLSSLGVSFEEIKDLCWVYFTY